MVVECDFFVASFGSINAVDMVSRYKGWPKTYPGYCLHLWNPPLHDEVAAVRFRSLNPKLMLWGLGLVAEDFIDVGNILGKIWVSLYASVDFKFRIWICRHHWLTNLPSLAENNDSCLFGAEFLYRPMKRFLLNPFQSWVERDFSIWIGNHMCFRWAFLLRHSCMCSVWTTLQ